MKDFADVVKPEQQVYSIATEIHVKETIYIRVDALTVEFKLLIEFVVVMTDIVVLVHVKL